MDAHHSPSEFKPASRARGIPGIAICTNKDCREPLQTSGCKRCGELLLDREDFCENCESDLFGDDA